MFSRFYVATLWLLSGLPVGLVLIFLPPAVMVAFFVFSIVVEEAHNAAPFALAWSKKEFRHHALTRQPWKYIGIPWAITLVLLVIGTVTQLGWTSWNGSVYGLTDWTNLLPVAMWVYWPWKIYHFGMQNFGVLQLLRIGQRRQNMVFCLLVTFVGMAVVPELAGSREIGLMMLAMFSVNHWVTDLGLSGRAFGSRWWVLIGCLLAVGAIGFVWLIPTPDGLLMRVTPIVIALRLSTGFVHFLYSRWVWKSNGPVARSLGRATLAPA